MVRFLQRLSTALLIAAFLFLGLGLLLTDMIWLALAVIYSLVGLVVVLMHTLIAEPTHIIYKDV